MRVNEVLARLDDLEVVKLSTREICWQGTKIQLVHDERFNNNRWGDMFVTHLGSIETILGMGIFIKGEKLL